MPALSQINFRDANYVKVLNVEVALAAAKYPTSTNFIDVSAFKKFAFLICVGALNSAVTVKVQEATAADGTPADITGATVVIGATDDNETFLIEVDASKLTINSSYRFVTLDVAGPAAADDFAAIIFLGWGAGVQPVTQPAAFPSGNSVLVV